MGFGAEVGGSSLFYFEDNEKKALHVLRDECRTNAVIAIR